MTNHPTDIIYEKPNPLVRDMFFQFNSNNVQYAVLRGYETLPDKVVNDIDLYLSLSQWKDVVNIIDKLCEKYALIKLNPMNRLGFRRLILFSRQYYLQLDFSFYINWKSFEYCTEKQLISNTKQHNNITVLVEGVESAIVLLKEILYNGKIKTRRKGKERLFFCVQKEKFVFVESLTPFIHKNVINDILEYISNKNWMEIEAKTNDIRRSIILANLKKKPILTVLYLLQWLSLAVKGRLSSGAGSFVAIIGPDGSGKTTLVNAVNKELDGTLFSKTNHFASNFEILPLLSTILNSLKGKRDDDQPRVVDQYQGFYSGMKQKVNSPIRSCIYILWYSLDHILGRYILWKKKSNGELIFFARYFYDYYYQRANQNAPKWLLVFMLLLIPKPDLVFYIDRSAANIFEQKPELSVHEIKRQQDIIQKLASKDKRFVRVDGNQGVEHSKNQIIESLAKLLAGRVKK